MINDWTDNWEEYFTRLFRANLTYAQQERGKDPELEELAEQFIQKVIPRLLRPLQTGGRSIKPTLCLDLQCMGDPRYALSMEFIDMYKDEVGASEPQEDFYDRHDLYAIRNNNCTAGMWPQWAPLLQTRCVGSLRSTLKVSMVSKRNKFMERNQGYSLWMRSEEIVEQSERQRKPPRR
ncbi:hypothetical protein DL766_004679 [Monosporascus sp. MC13-8B]|uniref:Uncharacterized protein n=1 Tax=Monosporascus cannonballus TaxID=155416 RepID=A0ABY0H811_9PEZI|nr:hypothetical protein DL762_004333 [Monosporascus cannonballus]RYO99274.1 hypothetical protein DL763_001638 [Monosporascus cannonballus]RYP30852.1 hypothetical protein DL766_004679 [Monosporascus sp. MC13-8B]